jgi:2-dehydro-3-deoxyglucarate aldolase/4-hydroxy-2-oxoheptanedioate aldolase
MLLEFNSRGMAQILEQTGIDFVVVDMEHSGFTSADVANLIAWFKLTSIAPFVRVPEIQYHFVARSLDAGALGIMAPNVKSASEARALVDAAKYAPLGRRGVGIGTANTDYESVNPGEYLEYANENTTIICQIESQQGLDDLEGIAGTPGVDVLWVGHFDLSHSLGVAGQFQHPRFLDALQRVVEVSRRHGLGAAIQPGSPDQAEAWMRIGFDVISYSGDIFLYIAALKQAVAAVRRLAGD